MKAGTNNKQINSIIDKLDSIYWAIWKKEAGQKDMETISTIVIELVELSKIITPSSDFENSVTKYENLEPMKDSVIDYKQHTGQESPVSPMTQVEVILRDGDMVVDFATYLTWKTVPQTPRDIVAYRIIENKNNDIG